MTKKNDIIKKLIARGVTGGALGTFFTGKGKRSDVSILVGAALGASVVALDEALETGEPVLFEEDGFIYRLYPDGRQEFVRAIEHKKVNVPKKFSLE